MNTDHDHAKHADEALISSAVHCIAQKSNGVPLTSAAAITLNFHPDTTCGTLNLVSQLANEGIYRSQFETGSSNGSVSAHTGGSRWKWESAMFCGIYDSAHPAQRVKYGALNYDKHSAGAAPRFGSAHLRLKYGVLDRATFAYPDSHFNPVDFGTRKKMNLIALAKTNAVGLDSLDNYIEAHVHGPLLMNTDVEAIVLDPSFKNTPVELAAHRLPFDVEWHDGFRLVADRYADCLAYRDYQTAEFLQPLFEKGDVNAACLTAYRDGSIDPQIVKKAWHCIVRFGGALT
ncbi:MAG: DUF3626 domain-containing protein [Granulosicoccus sp.]